MKKLLITLLVLVVLLVGADFGARAIAESIAAKALAEQTKTTDPDVDVHGFPFLTQAIRGRYDHVTVTADQVRLGSVDARATVDGYDVRYPLSDAIHGRVDSMTAGRAVLTVRTPASTFGAVLNAPGVTVAAGTDGALQIRTTVTVAGRSVPISAAVSVSVTKGVLQLRPGTVSFGGLDSTSLPATVRAAATRALTFDIPLRGLPVDLQDGHLTVDGDDLLVTAEVHDVALADFM